jgi:hypothetical protein
MKVKWFKKVARCDARNHDGFMSLRLQAFESDGPKNHWAGISHFLPGGGARRDPSPFEKVHVGSVGTVTLIINAAEFVLSPMDSCTVAHDEVREIVNHQNNVATTLVVMPYPA